MRIRVQILLLMVFSLPGLGFARSWSEPSLTLQNSQKVLEHGNSKFQLNTTHAQINRRYAKSGKTVGLTRVRKTTPAREQTGSIGRENYQTSMERTTVLPQWSTGIMPGWMLGVQVPLVKIDFDKKYDDNTGNRSSATRLGNVEVASKQLAVDREGWTVTWLQKVEFPSAEIQEIENETQYSEEYNNYVVGLGSSVAKRLDRLSRISLTAVYNYTFDDTIDDRNVNQRVRRNPGDEVVLLAQLNRRILTNLSTRVKVLYGYKFKDEILDKNLPPREEISSYQTLAGAEVHYQFPKANEFSANYATAINYQQSINGRNSENLATLGLAFELVY